MLKNRKRIQKILAVLVFLCLPFFSQNVFADIITDPSHTGDLKPCGAGADRCYSGSYTKHGGGLVWVFYRFPDPKNRIVDYSKFKVLDPPSSKSWNCNLEGTEGAFFLTKVWHKNGSTQWANYLFGPVKKSSAGYASKEVRSPDDIPISEADLQSVTEAQAKAAWMSSYNNGQTEKAAEEAWEAGDFSAFCGNLDNGEYQSYSQVYSPNNGTATSTPKWTNGGTATLEVTVDPTTDKDIDFYFNHYLKNTNNASANTSWVVIRSQKTAVRPGVTYTDITGSGGTKNAFNGIATPVTGVLETKDTNEHTVPISGGSGYNRGVRVHIPGVGNEDVNYTIEFCEQVNFQSNNKGDLSANRDRWSYVCVKIHVTHQKITITDNCPLSYYTPPAKGTKDSGTTTSGSGVRTSVFQTYSKFAYVKPTDQINWAHCYFPEAQAVKHTSGSHPHPSYSDGTTRYNTINIQDTYVAQTKNLGNEFNLETTKSGDFSPSVGFSISNNSFSLSGSSTIKGTVGSTDNVIVYSKVADLSYTIGAGHSGDTVKQAVKTQNGTNSVRKVDNSWTWTYYVYEQNGSYCGYTKSGEGENKTKTANSCNVPHTGHGYHKNSADNYFYEISDTTSYGESSSASVYIPYNFTTGVSTAISQQHTQENKTTDGKSAQDEIVLAGESYTVNARVSILPRTNNTTRGSYATEPPSDTKVEIVIFYLSESANIPYGSSSANTNGVCQYYGNKVKACNTVGTYSRDGNNAWMNSIPDYSKGTTYTLTTKGEIYNVPAGYKVCSAVGISHTDSKNDTNDVTEANRNIHVNNNWNISSPTCRAVAKNPNLQVWGGSIFTNGNIKTSATTKTVLGKTFGSWGEFAVIAGGSSTIDGLGSGASLGYTNSYYSDKNHGGNSNSLFSQRTPLSVANSNCVNNQYCTNISGSGISANSTIMNRLISRFVDVATTATKRLSGSISLSASSSYDTYGSYRLTRANNGLTISSPTELAAGVTHIVYVENGDLNINANLTYAEKVNSSTNVNYENISQIPQFIFIVKNGNINIAPYVSRVDAWLISAKNIDTCATQSIGSNLSASSCGTPLTINGPVIAGSITPKRAYGAGAQDSSGAASVGSVTFSDQYNVTSAEVFNLPLASYLWAYAQALSNPRAYTVYTRTLAPRL